ncbi:hypothetical protein A3759_22935 [Thalassolituus sp. HI0120]|nr:hypothetical protein A3759_22935 [Thalassolituus sp. HI0120]
MYLRFAEVSYQDWKEHYIDHKLVGFIARRLIWRIENEKFSSDVIFSEGNYVTSSGNQVVIPENVTIRLWHPSMSEAQEVLRWRDYLIRSETTQPFKQAHREIYLLTDAERSTQDYSLRFENHILKQSQFHALATQRGWSQNRGGSWDGGDENSAFKSIPTHGISVELEATGAENYGLSDSGIYQCVATGKVIFSKKSQQNLVNIDPLLFSEVMRDIDLFVGVTSIGNDPDWRNRDDNYWQTSSFGDLSEPAKIRKDVIQSIIPKLKISNQLKIEGKFLIVEGNLQTYKIHLGSSNILMEPNDSYLCIVESRSSPNVMLPFEGDKILSLILSKATILANDSKIKDKTILSQINRSIETLEDVE